MAQGSFRRGLYFRLNVLSVRIPLLRERRQDIPLLATAFLERVSQSSSRPVELSDDAMKALLDYDWPGNVRELENCLERCCAMSSGPVIHIVDFPSAITGAPIHLTDLKADARILPISEVESGPSSEPSPISVGTSSRPPSCSASVKRLCIEN